MKHLKIVALASGSGSNLQSIIDAIEKKQLNAEISLVVSSKRKAGVIARAEKHNIPVIVVERRIYKDNIRGFSAKIAQVISDFSPDLILLCGFLSFLSEEFCQLYENRIFNIHPSLLPAFGGQGAYGIRVHRMALKAGVKVSGCTVMFVDAGQDTGPIIVQKCVPVLEDDTEESLAQRVMTAEYQAYPEAVRLFGQGRLSISNNTVKISQRKDED